MQETLCYGIGYLSALFEYEKGYEATIKTASGKKLKIVIFKEMPKLDQLLVKNNVIAFRGEIMEVNDQLKIVANRLKSGLIDSGEEYAEQFEN